jgi:hypothetical protein
VANINNGTSNVNIAAANANVTVSVNGTSNVAVFATTGEYITGELSASGNVTGGNVLTGGLISATSTITSAANITGGNVLTGGLISATANVTGGNLLSGGLASVTGNVTGGNVLTAGIVSATSTITSAANVVGGNILTAGYVSATGNVTGGNVLTAGLISATSTITSAANITGGNLLSGGVVSATANVTGGNLLTGGLASIAGNVTGGNVLTGGLISAGGNITSSTNVNTPNVVGATGLTVSTGSGDLALTPSGNINASNNYINNLLDPVLPQDAVPKQYVDNAVSSGITIHTPVLVESPTALNGTYAQGGTTATVTSTVAGNTVVFGSAISPQVNDQYWFTSAFNGILADTAYFVVSAPNTSAAVLSTSYNGAPVANITGATGLTQPVRINSGIGATLTNAGANATLTIDGVTLSNTNRVLIYTQANAVHNGVYVVSEAGNATTAWQLTRSTDTDVYGPKSTEELDVGDYFFVQSGDTGAGESYVMTAPEGTFIIGYNNLTFTQFSASQVYTANTAAGLSLIGTVFNAKVDGVTTAFDGGGNISVKASANLTTPNIGAATGTSLNTTANITGGNLLTGGLISATSTITSAANITGGNVLTGGLISAAGNITSGSGSFFIGNGSQLTGVIATSAGFPITAGNSNIAGFNNANIAVTVGGTANVAVFATTGEYITGELSASGNVTGGNVLTGGLVSATANVTGGNLLTGGLISATSTITSAANIIGGNILTGGAVSATGNATFGNISTSGSGGNISGANVISGTTLSASGNVIGGNVTTAGLISATGNVTGNYFNGNGYFLTGVITSVANINNGTSNVNIAAANANVTVSVNGTANVAVFATTGEYITGELSASGNVTGGNVLTGGLISATSTITSAANVTGGNLLTGGLISATSTITSAANITGGNILTGGLISATANITGGNLLTAGLISATGNITGGNVTATNYYYANGIAIVNYTASGTPPASPTAGWQWYNTSTDVLYEYIFDGTDDYWVDISSPAFAGGVVANVSIAGSMLVNANAAYDIGSSSQTFRDVYAQNYYGNGATLTGIITSVSNINNGTSNVTVNGSGGNVTTSVGGTANVGVFYNGGLSITGDLTVTGNATLSGNILGDRVQNGTTSIDIQTAGGNANVNIGGTGNLAVFSPGNLVMTGNINPSANITYDLGTSTQRWKDIYLANSTIYLGAAQITANATASQLPTPQAAKQYWLVQVVQPQ